MTKISAIDPIFQQHLIDHGVYPEGATDHEGLEVVPANLKEIKTRLLRRRSSLSPSHFPLKSFKAFQNENRQALTETAVMSKAFPIIAGTTDIPSQGNLPFGNLKNLTDGSIRKAQPDMYDGSDPKELNGQIRKKLGSYIVPSTNTSAPCLPNFFTEGKGPNGVADVGRRQVLYDGALGARGIHELRSHLDSQTAYDNNAYTITSTYHHNGSLTLYTTHPTKSNDPQKPIEYRMTRLGQFTMTGSLHDFRTGAKAFRNARDWAKEKREALIAAANQHHGWNLSVEQEPERSGEEPPPGSETGARPRTPDGARTNPPLKISSSSKKRAPVKR